MNAFRAMSYSAIASFAKLLGGLVTIKVIALSLGPDALGLLGQFMSVVAILVVLTTGGTSLGVTRCTAERIADRQGTSRLLRTASMISIVVCALIIMVTIFYAKHISSFLFGSEEYVWALIFSSFLLLPLGFSGLGQAVINGQSNISALAKVHVGAAVLGSIGIVLIVRFYQEYGAVFGLTWIAASPAFLVCIWWWRHDTLRFSDLIPSFDKRDASILMRYSGFVIYSILVQNLVQIWIRSNLESVHDWTEVGYWQAMVRISDAYLQVFVVFLLAYLFPRLSQEKDYNKSLVIVFSTYKLILAPLLIVLIFGYFLRDLVIEVLLSDDFFPVRELFFPQMLGDFFKILAFIPGYLVIARGYVPLVLVAEPLQAVLLMSLNFLFSDQYGALGSIWAYALTYAVYFIISMGALGFYAMRTRRLV